VAGIEKRKERRIKISLPLKIIYEGKELSGFTGNISRLGAYAQMDRDLPIGANIDVVLEIPAYTKDSSFAGKISCKGNIFRVNFIKEVKGKKYFGLGIFFTGFPQQKDKERLSKYIDYLITEEEKGIKKGVKLWRNKRKMKKADTASAEGRPKGDDNSDIIALLRQILARLKEIRSLLKPAAENK